MSVRLLAALLLCACGEAQDTGESADEPDVTDDDGDGWATPQDCDDLLPGVSPGAIERCNGVDDDCDGVVDDTPLDGTFAWLDMDSDGWGDPASGQLVCENFVDDPRPFVLTDSDCDDGDFRVHPGATELCSEEGDEDCDGSTNDRDAYGCASWYEDRDGDGTGTEFEACLCEAEGAWRAASSGDCDDDDAAVIDGCGLTGQRWGEDADVLVYGGRPAENVGAALAPGGDPDEDGWPDLVLSGGRLAGGASWHRVRGPLGTTEDLTAASAVFRYDLWTATTSVGVAGGADLDGDGVHDTVMWGVGRLSGRYGGQAWLISGDARGEIDLSEADAHVSGVSSTATVWFDAAILTDRNGDAVAELGVASSLDTETWIGAGPFVGERSATDALLTLSLRAGSISECGDIDGDGLPELLVGTAPDAVAGVVAVIWGGASGSLTLADTLTLTSADNVFGFGQTTEPVGDLDGDGHDDVAGTGAVGATGSLFVFTALGSDDATTSDATFTLSAGASVPTFAGAGDIDADAYDDLVVGNRETSTQARYGGSGVIFFGPLSGSASTDDGDLRVYGAGEGDLFGSAAAGLGDLDLDSSPDFGFGAPGVDTAASEAGAAYVFFGGAR